MSQRLLKPEEVEEYRRVVGNYHPNDQIVVNFARSKFGVIAGPTGAGKDTLRNALVQDPNFVKILSTTSRPMRDGEEDGVEYHFRNLRFFDRGIEQQRFLQVALVHNQQLACLDFADIEQLNSEKIAIAILTVQIEIELRKLNPDMKTIFIIPPSKAELLNRINKEDHKMHEDEIARRLQAAKIELEIALGQPSYYCIVNDDINRIVNLTNNFLKNSIIDKAEDKKAREAINAVINELGAN